MLILNDNELELVILNFAATRGDKCITEEETTQVLSWANQTRAEQTFLELALKGYVSLDIVGGDVVFGLTEKGLKEGVTLGAGATQ